MTLSISKTFPRFANGFANPNAHIGAWRGRRAFLALGGSALLLSACADRGGLAVGGFDPIDVSQAETEAALNAIRRENGLGELVQDTVLLQLAVDQAFLMARYDVLSHEVTGNNAFRRRMIRSGYGAPAGENLSAGRPTLAAAIKGWMNSPDHRENMLNPGRARFGIAAARVAPERKSRYGIYWALMLGNNRAA
jgi:Cysteine-rich secretory protein family